MDAFDWGNELLTLPGQRVSLRHLSAGDAADVLAVFGDPEVMRFWSAPPFQGLAEASALIDEIHGLFRARRLFQWGICSHETNKIVGTCTLFNMSASHQRAEVGFATARAIWGQGLASEAVELLIQFALRTLRLHRLEADCDPENARCLRLLERQGFKREGYLRERWYHLGKRQDGVFLGLLAPEWSPRNG